MSSPAQSDIAASPTPGSASQLAALLQDVALSHLHNIGWIRVTGEDRVRWLNGMVTNSIQDLHPGQGTYNFFLSVQGRIQGDATIFASHEDLLMETSSDQLTGLIALLDRFIIMDDVELGATTGDRAGLLLVGPEAEVILKKLGIAIELPQQRAATVYWQGEDFPLIHAYSPLVPRWELWIGKTVISRLTQALLEAGAVTASPEALEHLRLLSGTPRYGIDIRDKDLPQETNQLHALHFTKGCYLGQEIVERIRSRGNVHRTLTGLQLTGTLPTPGTAIEAQGKPVGEITSSAAIQLPASPSAPAQTIQLALAYLRREALDNKLSLTYPGGTATPIALPYPLH
jgi:folate-binding protein YgfZ